MTQRKQQHGPTISGSVLLLLLVFPGLFEALGGCFHNNKLLLCHCVEQDINMLAATAVLFATIFVKELIHRNIEKRDEFEKQIEAGVLTFVLNAHNGAVSAPDQFPNIRLCPAFFFSGLF